MRQSWSTSRKTAQYLLASRRRRLPCRLRGLESSLRSFHRFECRWRCFDTILLVLLSACREFFVALKLEDGFLVCTFKGSRVSLTPMFFVTRSLCFLISEFGLNFIKLKHSCRPWPFLIGLPALLNPRYTDPFTTLLYLRYESWYTS